MSRREAENKTLTDLTVVSVIVSVAGTVDIIDVIRALTVITARTRGAIIDVCNKRNKITRESSLSSPLPYSSLIIKATSTINGSVTHLYVTYFRT